MTGRRCLHKKGRAAFASELLRLKRKASRSESQPWARSFDPAVSRSTHGRAHSSSRLQVPTIATRCAGRRGASCVRRCCDENGAGVNSDLCDVVTSIRHGWKHRNRTRLVCHSCEGVLSGQALAELAGVTSLDAFPWHPNKSRAVPAVTFLGHGSV